MSRIEHLVTSLAWAVVGLMFGMLAGLTAGWRSAQPASSTDAVVHRYAADLRNSARMN